MRAAPAFALLAALLLACASGVTTLPGRAQITATPLGEVPCDPPAPATPSPTPAPTAEPPLGVGPTPTPEPDADAVVDPLLEPMVTAAAANLEACWNAGAWEAVAGIVTPRFLESALGIVAPDAAARSAALAALDLGLLRMESIGPIGIWSDGRGAVDVLYLRGRGSPVQAVAARWFFRAERGVVSFDEEVTLSPPPLGDRVTIGFAIADDVQPLQWSSLDGGQIAASPATALHGANRGQDAHTFILQEESGETLGLLTLPSWRQGDLLLLDLPPGTYQLLDPAVAGSTLTLVVG